MLNRINRVMRSNDIEFAVEHIPDEKGIILGLHNPTDFGSKITINVIDHILPTLVHECLHEIFPQMGERKVDKLANKIVDIMSRTQKRNLYNLWLIRVGGLRGIAYETQKRTRVCGTDDSSFQ